MNWAAKAAWQSKTSRRKDRDSVARPAPASFKRCRNKQCHKRARCLAFMARLPLPRSFLSCWPPLMLAHFQPLDGARGISPGKGSPQRPIVGEGGCLVCNLLAYRAGRSPDSPATDGQQRTKGEEQFIISRSLATVSNYPSNPTHPIH